MPLEVFTMLTPGPMLAQVGSLFTAPWLAAVGAAAVSVPVAIHLLSRFRRTQEPWGAMRFLVEAYRRHKRRLHMEQWLLLLVRCLLVLLLGLALSGPLMGGFVGELAGGLDRRGRVVHILISDSLSSRVTSGEGGSDNAEAAAGQRFDAWRDQALAMIDALRPSDRVALWRTARPAEPLTESPTRQHQKVRGQLEQMQPRFSRPDLPQALAGVAQQLRHDQVSPDRGKVIVLSDFARSSRYLGKLPSEATRRLAEHAELRITRPASAAANAQVQSLTPRRRLVLAPAGAGASVPVAATLRRFGETTSAAQRQLEVTLMSLAGDTLATQQTPVRWRQGDNTTSVNLTTLSPDPPASPTGEGGRTWLIRGRLTGSASTNRLSADDAAWATLTARSHLNVGLIGQGATPQGEQQLPPQQWLTLALTPQGPGEGAMRPQAVEPGAVGGSDESLAELDAAFVVRPGRLNASGWAELGEFARAGGLVWVVPPPRPGGAGWVEPMQQHLGLAGWRIAMEPRALAGGDAEGARRLDTDHPTPEPLARLAADWASLVRPIRITRWLAIDAPPAQSWLVLQSVRDSDAEPAPSADADAGEGGAGSGGGSGGATDQTGAAADQATAVLASRQLGAGRVVVQGLALSTQWTNLPTKPVMLPLVQETLRSTVGPSSSSIVAGDRPTLGARWTGIDALQRLPVASDIIKGPSGPEGAPDDGGEGDDESKPAVTVPLQSAQAGPASARAVRWPGPYRAAEAGLALAVNPDPAGGDPRAAPQQRVADWFDQLAGASGWAFLPADNPASALARSTQPASLGWPLLWAVLALAIIEMLLARHFAHAQRMDQPSVRSRLAQLWHRLHGGTRPSRWPR